MFDRDAVDITISGNQRQLCDAEIRECLCFKTQRARHNELVDRCASEDLRHTGDAEERVRLCDRIVGHSPRITARADHRAALRNCDAQCADIVIEHEQLDGAIDRKRAEERVAGDRPASDHQRLDTGVQLIAGRRDLSDQAVQVWRRLRRVSFAGHRLTVLELRFQRAQPDTKRVAGVGHYFRPQKAGKLRRVPTRWIIRAELMHGFSCFMTFS